MAAPAAAEVESTDLPVLRAEARRLRSRLEYWTGRASELEETDTSTPAAG